MIKFCQCCKDRNIVKFTGVGGYYWVYLDTTTVCDVCGSSFENIDFPALDLKVLTQVSQDVNFIEAMIKLRQDSIIEYESRMSQFRIQVQQQEQLEQKRSNNIPKCPTCGSTNIRPISGTERAVSVIGLGLFSKKINKTYKCLNCKHTW